MTVSRPRAENRPDRRGPFGLHGTRGVPDARRLLLVAATMLLSACGSVPPEPPRAEREAASLNQRAARALAAGRTDAAQALYEEALRINRSIENIDGIAVSLLALAHVHQARGDVAQAHRRLDELLAEGPLRPPPARLAEAAGRKSLLHLSASSAAQASQTSQASIWAERAEALCPAECAARGAILNLRARAALASGDAPAAQSHARRALAALGDSAATAAERANALRVIGEAALALRNPGDARAALEPALELDRAAGRGDRVWRDLLLLARAATLAGEREAARMLHRRALDAALAASGGAGPGAAEAAAGADEARRALQQP